MAPTIRPCTAPTGVAVLAVGLALASCLPAVHAPTASARPSKGGEPFAKLDADLAALYASFREFAARTDAPDSAYVPDDSTLRVVDARVAVDATASGDPGLLERDLESLGLASSARVGPVVSGFLPIRALPDAAALTTLRRMTAARAGTR